MTKKIKFPIQPDDIPAWFMTYSDVITLLMTFFILMLTFATTEPERYEKVQTTPFSSGGATGVAGKPIDGLPKDSFIHRVRPPSSRIAMRGAEMPPITSDPLLHAFGKGLQSLDPNEQKHNEMTSHYFDVPLNRLFDAKGNLTSQARHICQTLAVQLRDLPFQASFQFANPDDSKQVVQLMDYMFRTQKTRPGQVALSRVQKPNLAPDQLRIVIKRDLGNAP